MGAVSIATRGIISKREVRYIEEALKINIEVRNIDINIDVENNIDINITKE